MVAGCLAVGAQQTHVRVELRVAGDHRTAVAPGAEVLGRVEAEAAGVAKRSGRPTAVPGPVGLASVLDDEDAPRPAEREQGIHVHGAAVQMHGDDAARLRRQRRLDDLGGQQSGLLVYVDQSWGRAGGTDRLGGRYEAVGRDDHLVAGADSEPAQRQLQCSGAGGNPDRVLGIAPSGELPLEARHLLAEREGGVPGDSCDDVEELGEQLRVGVVEAREGHLRRRHLVRRDGCAWSVAGAHAVVSSEGLGPAAGTGTVAVEVNCRSAKTAAASLRE